jgi:dihydroorotate dehydrogenase
VEMNFSCPNVSSADGQIYRDPGLARLVAETARAAVGKTPLLAKIGLLETDVQIENLITAADGVLDGLVLVNGVSARVIGTDGKPMFGGQPRGVCGGVIRELTLDQITRFQAAKIRLGASVSLVHVGGISTAQDVCESLDAGAAFVQMATAPMVDPLVGIRIRRDLQSRAAN